KQEAPLEPLKYHLTFYKQVVPLELSRVLAKDSSGVTCL
ncbi:MAG: hypothetical protein JWR09_2691, partial [Mucilaginibacter sp.]|nr:hypothetical protein [Mucilaginibacter sp.]